MNKYSIISKSLPINTFRGFVYPKSIEANNELELLMATKNSLSLEFNCTIRFKYRKAGKNNPIKRYAVDITINE